MFTGFSQICDCARRDEFAGSARGAREGPLDRRGRRRKALVRKDHTGRRRQEVPPQVVARHQVREEAQKGRRRDAAPTGRGPPEEALLVEHLRPPTMA